MRRIGLLLLGSALLAAAGCRNSGELVEAELRTQENQNRELREELYRAESYNNALERENHDLRQHPVTALSPEQASQTYTLKDIALGRGTGGYDDDNLPGDEALQVIVEPRDPDGHAIKAPGALHVVALEISPEGLKTPISSWDVSPDQLRRTWRTGLFSTGYDLKLPWKTWPTSTKVRVVAQFTLADGRAFEAEKDVTIHLAATHPRPAASPPAIEIPATKPVPPETLPFPRKEEGPVLGAMPHLADNSRPAPLVSFSRRPNDSLAGAVLLEGPVRSK